MYPIVNKGMSNNFEHCHVHTTDFLSSKAKFIHTSTVARSHSCYGKKTTRTPPVHLVGYCIKQKEIGKLLGLFKLKCVNDII